LDDEVRQVRQPYRIDSRQLALDFNVSVVGKEPAPDSAYPNLDCLGNCRGNLTYVDVALD
jgi:hypothetical protein